MVRRCVRVYIEGGGQGGTSDNDFRRGWKRFLIELHDLARNNGYHGLEVVRGRGRAETFHGFKKYMNEHPDDLCVLLVDAEMAVPDGARVWDIVSQRDGDKWQRPTWATENHLYLMTHFVETWLLTDQDALKAYFKRGFNSASLPTTNLEHRTKDEIEQALQRATRDSSKGAYRHGQAHEIMEIVNPDKVKTLSHGQRLFKSLGSLIKSKAEA